LVLAKPLIQRQKITLLILCTLTGHAITSAIIPLTSDNRHLSSITTVFMFTESQPSDGGNSDILTVSQLNQAVGRLLERSFPLTWISGEISNFTRAASGHWYFTLKDASAQVRAVMFRGRAQFVDFAPREGDKVEVRAMVSLYAARGDFQLSVEAMRKAGVGNLYEAFLKLKAKLASEGLFDTDRKRELPVFPRQIGIVTSPQAAALRDVITTLRRRAPHLAGRAAQAVRRPAVPLRTAAPAAQRARPQAPVGEARRGARAAAPRVPLPPLAAQRGQLRPAGAPAKRPAAQRGEGRRAAAAAAAARKVQAHAAAVRGGHQQRGRGCIARRVRRPPRVKHRRSGRAA
jgi:hypothetical protein